MSKKNDYVFLESPIDKPDDDIFNVSAYVEQLYAAFSSGAKFVAVNGKFGSGKSSVVNLFENRIDGKRKTFFVRVNFLNINQKKKLDLEINNGDVSDDLKNNFEEDIVNSYHRYFVNQVANDLYDNPYEIEKLFYNNFISGTVIKKPRNKIFALIVDKLLLILISFAAVILMYFTFLEPLKNDFGIVYFINKFFPFLLFVIFVLVVLYGYGFYKPEQQERSPMLDVDKCRICFSKILFDIIPKKSTIYFIIDDLDRIDSELQRQIISLLYNEYYPLDNLIKDIKLKFIFMIDLSKINKDKDYMVDYDKLFDYIINVSNNQKYVLHKYVELQINNNRVLNEIFRDVKIKDYLIGLIVENYSSIRKIKHLFNNIITKYIYLNFKKDINFSNVEMILICILVGICDSTKLNNFINYQLNDIESNNMNLNDNVKKIINYALQEGYIDNNYYIYLYNFMNSDDIMNEAEQLIYNEIHDNLFVSENNWNNVYKYLDSTSCNFSNVYNHIYKYLSNDDKIMFLGNEKFNRYIFNNYGTDGIDFTNIYKIYNISFAFPIIYKYLSTDYKYVFIRDLDNIYNEYFNSRYNNALKSNFESEFNIFINNMEWCIAFFDIRKYMSVYELTKDYFDKLLEFKNKNNVSVIFDMVLENKFEWKSIIKFIDSSFIKDISNINDDLYRDKVFSSLLLEKISLDEKLYILTNMKSKYNSYEVIFEEFNGNNSFEIDYDNLICLLNIYGYNFLLDKYIIKYISRNEYRNQMIIYINANKFNLSVNIITAIDKLKTKYAFSEYYENNFIKNEFYELYIFSNLIRTKSLKYNNSLSSESKYIDAINSVYVDMSSVFSRFKFSKGITDIIVDTCDFKKIDFNRLNFWKIDILVPSLVTYQKCCRIFDRLLACNLLNEYILYYKNDVLDGNIRILFYLAEYANNKNLDSSVKANITKAINKRRNNDNN